MINLEIRSTKIMGLCYEPITVGCINSIFLNCSFAPEWDGLARIAVFTNGSVSVSVSMESGICAIPHETLASPGELLISFRGIGDDGNYVLCTENKCLGKVIESFASTPPSAAEAATPDVVDSLLADVAALRSSIESCIVTSGKSAYEVALDNGFEGTEQEWLASLHGADGADGADGIDGQNGADGRDGIDGQDGADGYTPVKGVDYFTAADIAQIIAGIDLSAYATLTGVQQAIQSAIGGIDALIGGNEA